MRSATTRNDAQQLRAAIAGLDASEVPGSLDIYTDPQPPSGADPGPAVLLGTSTLQAPASLVTSLLLSIRSAIPGFPAQARGTPGWMRLKDGDGNFVADLKLQGALISSEPFVIGDPYVVQELVMSADAWDQLALRVPSLVLPPGTLHDLTQYVTGGIAPYAAFSAMPLPAGVTINAESGLLSVATNAAAVALSDVVYSVTDYFGTSALSPPARLEILAPPPTASTNITLQRDEYWSIVKSLGAPMDGKVRTSITLAPTSAALPPGVSIIGNGTVLGATLWAGTANANYQGIWLRQNYSNAPAEDVGPYDITLLEARPPMVTHKRGDASLGQYRTLDLAKSSGKLQPGDVLECAPGLYYSPISKYQTQLGLGNLNGAAQGSLIVKSAIPGQKVIIDTSDALTINNGVESQTGYDGVVVMNQFQGLKELTLIDFHIRSKPRVSDIFACFWSKGGFSPANSQTITLQDCIFEGGSNGIIISGPQPQDANFADNLTSLTLIGCEFKGCGWGDGTTHNAYVNHIAKLKATACWSHNENIDGHLFKTKAKQNTFTACRFSSLNGQESFLLDLSLAGDALLEGCLFEKFHPTSFNAQMISVGREHTYWGYNGSANPADGRTMAFRMRQCTLINYSPAGQFIDYGNVGGSAVPLAANEIIDCVLAGPNAPSASGSTVVLGSYGSALLRAATIPAGNSVLTRIPTEFPTYFEDPANQNYRLINPAQGSQNWAALEYVQPVSSKARADGWRGAVSSPTIPVVPTLPAWASLAALPSGSWNDVSLNTIHDPALAPAVTWPNQSSPYGQIITQYSGGCYCEDYSTFGGIAITGNGHASQVDYLANAVLVWNLDTQKWERCVPSWYDPAYIVPAPGATLRWGGGLEWSQYPPTTRTQQTDPDLVFRCEYVVGQPAASHTYCNTTYIPAQWAGNTKGMLLQPNNAATGGGTSGSSYPPNGPNSDIRFFGVYSHAADLSAGTWGRYTLPGPSEAAKSSHLNGQGSACTDTRRGKAFYIGYDPANCQAISEQIWPGVTVYDFATRTAKVARFTTLAHYGSNLGGNQSGFCFCPHPTNPLLDMIVNGAGTINVGWAAWFANLGASPQAEPAAGGFWCRLWEWLLSLLHGFSKPFVAAPRVETSTGGFWAIQTTGTPPLGGVNGWWGWEYCPELDSIVAFDRNTMSVYKLKLPANRLDATGWAWSSEQLVKAGTSAASNPNDWNINGHRNRWRYAHKAKCFLLCDGETRPMRAFRPTGIL